MGNEHIFPDGGEVEASFLPGDRPDHYGLRLDFDGRTQVIHLTAAAMERLGFQVLDAADAAKGHESDVVAPALVRAAIGDGVSVGG